MKQLLPVALVVVSLVGCVRRPADRQDVPPDAPKTVAETKPAPIPATQPTGQRWAERVFTVAGSALGALDKLPEPEPPRIDPRLALLHTVNVFVSAPQLHADYEENAVAADRKYKGKTLGVVSEVRGIETDFNGKPCVSLSAGVGFLNQVQCRFDKSRGEDVIDLQPGDWVVIVGTGAGKNGRLYSHLDGCRVVLSAPTPDELQRRMKELEKK